MPRTPRISPTAQRPGGEGPVVPADGSGQANTGLVRSVNSDKRPAFEELYARMAMPALRYANAIAGGDGEDACQEAWLRIWRSWDDADEERREAWAFRVVRNAALDRLRRRRPVEPLEDLELPTAGAVEDTVVNRMEGDAALGALAHLSLPLREALWLREVGDLTYAEVAGVQGVPVGTVMSRLHAARRQVARRLRREGR